MGKHKEIKVNGVTQRFVWIEPGSFLMGSPEDEAERYDEALHKVTLTKGFWLADTACTQELWQAVMVGNPSAFKDDARNPVENVSWYDVQQLFIERLNLLVPGLCARLPTEAEWEYACRAGSTTPFSFGDELTPALVNYDGQYSYACGVQGECRGTTVPVKTFPSNAWGLYEMHGNIWEWCADRYGDYANEPQVDPQGPPSSDLRMLRGAPAGMHPTWPFGGGSRVLRGGSWVSSGRNVRSASRYWAWPGNRSRLIGFRIAADGEKR